MQISLLLVFYVLRKTALSIYTHSTLTFNNCQQQAAAAHAALSGTTHFLYFVDTHPINPPPKLCVCPVI